MPTYSTFKQIITIRTVTVTKTIVNENKSSQSGETAPEADMSVAGSNLVSTVGQK